MSSKNTQEKLTSIETHLWLYKKHGQTVEYSVECNKSICTSRWYFRIVESIYSASIRRRPRTLYSFSDQAKNHFDKGTVVHEEFVNTCIHNQNLHM